MRDVSGYGANKSGIPWRDDLPLHDMTGGNTFVPDLVAQLFPAEVNLTALDAGKQRALSMLQNAASFSLSLQPEYSGVEASVIVVNETGHKLPSGYPEGRRIWIQLEAFDRQDNKVFESGAYNNETAELTKEDTKIYEIKLGLSETMAEALSTDIKTYEPGESFHFVLNDIVVKDNRIPPRGFTNDNFEQIQSPVVNYSYDDGQYWDETNYHLPSDAYRIVARLMYQTISKEYADFLRDENTTNNAGTEFYNLWLSHGKSTPVVMAETEMYNITTGFVNIQDSQEAVKIYPNPVQDIMHLKISLNATQKINIQMFDMKGRVLKSVYSGNMPAGQNILDINVSDFSSGNYIVQIIRNDEVISQTISIQ